MPIILEKISLFLPPKVACDFAIEPYGWDSSNKGSHFAIEPYGWDSSNKESQPIKREE